MNLSHLLASNVRLIMNITVKAKSTKFPENKRITSWLGINKDFFIKYKIMTLKDT